LLTEFTEMGAPMTRAAFAFEQTLKNKTKKDILAEKYRG
jgi:hypothetical protein